MDEEVKRRLQQACEEYVAVYKNLERLHGKKIILEHDLDKVNQDIMAFTRDEDDAIASINDIWVTYEEHQGEMEAIMTPALAEVNKMEVFGLE